MQEQTRADLETAINHLQDAERALIPTDGYRSLRTAYAIIGNLLMPAFRSKAKAYNFQLNNTPKDENH